MKKRITMLLIACLMLTSALPSFAARRGRSRGQTVRTEHSDNQKDVTGTVSAVNMGRNEIVVDGKTVNVPGYAPVTINGTRGLLMQIKVGDQASVHYVVHTATTIRSGSGSGRRGGSRSGKSSRESNTGTAGSIVADGVTITR